MGGIGQAIVYTSDAGPFSGPIIFPNGGDRLWRIRRLDIEAVSKLRRGPQALSLWFGGLHNIAIPSELMDVLNPAEIAAIYIGAPLLKRDNRHPSARNFGETVRALDDFGYPYIGGYDEWKTRFPTTSGSQIERLDRLPDDAKEAFLGSFRAPYRPSDADFPADMRAYHDPCDRIAYVTGIYRRLTELWESG